MKPILIVALTPVMLAGVAAPAAPAPYRAVGTEPFWSLTIDSRITYLPATGRTISARTPVPLRTAVGMSYRTAFIAVDLIHRRCNDGMSDRTYPDTVNVRIGMKRLRGCGGGAIDAGPRPPIPPGPPQVQLDGTRWTPVTIDNRPLFQMARARLSFDRGNIAVNAGCNTMSGRYRLERGRLFAPNLIGTQMACQPAVMAQDRAVAGLLSEGAEIRMLPGGRLELVSRRHRATFAKAR